MKLICFLLEKIMIIGISGKSGSGKSKIADDLAKELGAIVINFDKISHLSTETSTFKELVKSKISKDVFDKNGNIMRKKRFLLIFCLALAGTLSGYDVKNKALAPVKFSTAPKHADLKMVENGKLNFAIVSDLQAEQRLRKNCKAE